MNNKLKVHPSKYNEFGDTIENDGMDLRDYFANSAMQAMIANPNIVRPQNNRPKETEAFCKVAFEYADAMLKQREL